MLIFCNREIAKRSSELQEHKKEKENLIKQIHTFKEENLQLESGLEEIRKNFALLKEENLNLEKELNSMKKTTMEIKK